MDIKTPRHKSILRGAIVGGIFGVVAVLIAPFGIVIALIGFLRPILIPGIDLIVNPYFNLHQGTTGEAIKLWTLGVIFNVLIYAILGAILASIGSMKGLSKTIKILFIVVVIVSFIWFTGMTLQTFVSGIRRLATQPPIQCDSQESAVFSEFPHYENIVLEPRTEGETGYCRDEFSSTDSGEQILEYYKQNLTVHGWTVTVKKIDSILSFNKESQQRENKPANIYDLTGSRNGFWYTVHINDPPEEGLATRVLVRTGHRRSTK